MDFHLHWTPAEVKLVASMSSYTEMKKFALNFLKRLPGTPVLQVCGPISTGGRGSVQANMEAFREAIEWLSRQSKTVFDQRPFQIAMARLVEARTEPGYDHDLLNEFYLPVFESGHIHELHFLKGWQSSVGARWEHEQALRLDIAIVYLPEKF